MKQIKLHNGESAIVDDEDYDRLSVWNWTGSERPWGTYAYRHGRREYASRGKVERRTGFYMHRVIMGAKSGQIVDHINGNTLDNRRANLRFVTAKQNTLNRKMDRDNKSGYRGVGWHIRGHKWRSRVAGYHLGLFDDPVEAAKAYDAKALEMFGDFAKLNFPNA